jgi:peptide-methionine (R)-S-oxide reductase
MWLTISAIQTVHPKTGLPVCSHAPWRADKVTHSEAGWKKLLTPPQVAILRDRHDEAPFSSPFLNEFRQGTLCCAACGEPLFSTDAEYDSGTGWPSFFRPVSSNSVWFKLETVNGVTYTEVNCARCDGYLGRVYADGPVDRGGLRFAINGGALQFKSTMH